MCSREYPEVSRTALAVELSLSKSIQKGYSACKKRKTDITMTEMPVSMVAGVGFEPTTSGL